MGVYGQLIVKLKEVIFREIKFGVIHHVPNMIYYQTSLMQSDHYSVNVLMNAQSDNITLMKVHLRILLIIFVNYVQM